MIRSIEDAELITTSFNTKDAVMFNCLLGILSKQKKKKKWRKKIYKKTLLYTEDLGLQVWTFSCLFFSDTNSHQITFPTWFIIRNNKQK